MKHPSYIQKHQQHTCVPVCLTTPRWSDINPRVATRLGEMKSFVGTEIIKQCDIQEKWEGRQTSLNCQANKLPQHLIKCGLSILRAAISLTISPPPTQLPYNSNYWSTRAPTVILSSHPLKSSSSPSICVLGTSSHPRCPTSSQMASPQTMVQGFTFAKMGSIHREKKSSW